MFKIGDKVRYIFNPPRFHPIPNAQFGDEFVVVRVTNPFNGDIFIQGYEESFDIRRFELVEAAPLPDDDVNNRIDVQGNEMEYKAGDFVVWQDEEYGNAPRRALTVGKIYKIANIYSPRIVYLINDDGREISSSIHRFTKWIPKVGDMVKAVDFQNHPNRAGVGWMVAMEAQVGLHMVITKVLEDGIKRPAMVCLNNNYFWPIDGGIEPINVADAPAKALDEHVQGFNARVKGLVAAKKKKPVKPSKRAIMKKLQAQLAKHRETLQAKSTGKETASYAICFDDGKAYIRENTACHAGLNLYQNDRKVVALYDHVGKYYDNPDRIPVDMKPAFKKFVLFLMKRSPIAHAFKTKTWTEAYAKGMDMDVSKTGSELAVACCSLRFAHEHSGRIQVWDWCLKNKYDELTAYFMMNVAVKVNGLVSFYVDVRNWHNIVDGEKSFQGMVERMVKGFHDTPGKRPYSEHQAYKVSALVHGADGGKSLRTVLTTIIPNEQRAAWGADPNKWNEKQFRTVCDYVQKALQGVAII